MENAALRIPLSKTPEEAVGQLRNRSLSYNVIHQELTGKGMLLFMTRPSQRGNNKNLQVEYVRKTMLGWKWVWGGNFSNSEASSKPSAVHYMSLPELQGVITPFPVVFGYILNPAITRITVETMDGDAYEAKLTEVGIDEQLWFVLLPSSVDVPYKINAYDEA
ncbi:hypothetical protein [Paenibacillus sp. 453mf]|uniref:hypothetical protein n=1 Tax=Paenibacillus sp. 453mf TaxID=1761874 RepID=UPI0008EFF345|nr:hypothetical protein [Paenibacillus sp. 453mf]SFS53337.1 hypothetical protein SAMN04488601_1011427 [Paenibacillus sp. 453mf]